MDTSALTTAYEALRDYLNGYQLYDDGASPEFDRGRLSELFTLYYDAEAATLRAAAALQTDQRAIDALNEMARRIGYAGYAEMNAAGTIIDQNGKIKTDLINVKDLVAQKVRVEDKENGGVISIVPDQGMKMYERVLQEDGTFQTQVTASFTGQRIGSIDDIIPKNDTRIRITEVCVTDAKVNASKKLVLAEGVVSGSATTPVTVTVPAFELNVAAEYYAIAPKPGGLLPVNPDRPSLGETIQPSDVPLLSPLVIEASLKVNGEAKAHITGEIDRLMIIAHDSGTVIDGKPVLSYSYHAEFSRSAVMPECQWAVSQPDQPVKVELEYSFSQDDPKQTPGLWYLRASARKPGTSAYEGELVSDYISLGGVTYNASFYGNAMLLSSSINQYVGLTVPRTEQNGGAELIHFSTDNGFRADQNGQWRWSRKLARWIPADGVLYRVYSPNGGYGADLRQWSFDGSKMTFSSPKMGTIKMAFPKTSPDPKGPVQFGALSDYFVRVDQMILTWYDFPTIFVERNTVDSFEVTTFSGELRWHGYLVEVLYTGDWW